MVCVQVLGNDAAIRSSSARRAENRKLTSPKHLRTNKIVSRERSQISPPPATNSFATGERQDIVLPKKVPVAWIYLTAWMTRDQTVQFRNDIYDQDEQLLEATAEEAAFFGQAANHPLTAHMAQ